ncbi:MAG: hypothetical protein E4H14_12970 [Candidatus Thorarchaeota archaeon]|nr:MAG: hypothetical protein E4H14_12970 [Candidatus Thorarchaeota archaeon]
MARIGAKDVISGNIPEVNYLIITDKGWADDLAEAIDILVSRGWSIEQIWGIENTHFGLFKRIQRLKK